MNAPAIATVGGTCESDNVKVEFFQPVLNSSSCRILVLPLDVGRSRGNSLILPEYSKAGREVQFSKHLWESKKKSTNASSFLEDRQVVLVTVTGFLRKNNGQWLINYSWKY